jgi:hypothetical protein
MFPDYTAVQRHSFLNIITVFDEDNATVTIAF